MKKGLKLQFLRGIQVATGKGKSKKCCLCAKEFGFLTQEHLCKKSYAPI